ncbi:MAG: RIP metalloprotease [Mycolicibacterium sp.]|jgi:membrane-associated protease RseP (regulator of RpoE activity)|nr:RIP metalloprotease [Mycolicibacterium sp.]
MMYVLGVVLFALAILVSVALHECGHMWVARATGMKVRRYFVGFGPTLWSTKRPNKLGETEYGLKAIPLGGFCDIAGMTAADEIAPEDEPHAMYKQKVWKRVAVLAAGPAMNILIGLLLIYGIAVVAGLPNLHAPAEALIGETACVSDQTGADSYAPCTGPGPAAAAGIRPGDAIVKVGDTPVAGFGDLVSAVRGAHGPTPVTVRRDGTEFNTTVDVVSAKRLTGKGGDEVSTVGAIGVTDANQGDRLNHYNPLTAVPGTLSFTGDLSVEIGKSLARIPTKVGALVHSITGGVRDQDTPISVVGATRIGGETVEHGLWLMFWFFLAQLNFVLGAINLVPLLPFDGGHIAVACYEKLRNMVRSLRGLSVGAPVNYMKLMPATYVVLIVVVGYMLLTVTADFVNPVRLFQ